MVPYLNFNLSLSLDQLLSAGEYHVSKWSTGLESNKAWRILRYIIYRLWEKSGGQLERVRFTCAQASLSAKLGLSKRWTNILCQRLAKADWLRYETTTLPDGTNSSCIWRIGGQLLRLVITLRKSQQRKSPIKYALTGRSIKGPLSEREKEKNSSTQETGRISDGVSHPEDRRREQRERQKRWEAQEIERMNLEGEAYLAERQQGRGKAGRE